MAAKIRCTASDLTASEEHCSPTASPDGDYPGSSLENAGKIQPQLSSLTISINPPSKENINFVAHDGICKSTLRSGQIRTVNQLIENEGPRRSPRTAARLTEPTSEKKRSSSSADLPSSESLEAFSGSKLKKYSSLNSKNSKNVNGSTFFVGESVPDEEARQRWPHHYARQVTKKFMFIFKVF